MERNIAGPIIQNTMWPDCQTFHLAYDGTTHAKVLN